MTSLSWLRKYTPPCCSDAAHNQTLLMYISFYSVIHIDYAQIINRLKIAISMNETITSGHLVKKDMIN